jgi:D-methionine transport system substrate-binding protein
VPNAALDAGEIQANSFQNQPYLDNQKADRGYKIEAVGLTVNFPSASIRRSTSLGRYPEGGKVSIPNDPTNGGRVLLLLRRQGRDQAEGRPRVQADGAGYHARIPRS